MTFFPCDAFAESKWWSPSSNEPCCSDRMVYNCDVIHLLFGSMRDTEMAFQFFTVRFSSRETQQEKISLFRKKKKGYSSIEL